MSIVPGIVVASALEVAALVFLANHQASYTGPRGTWLATLAVWAGLPVLTAAFGAVTNRHWALRLLLLKSMVLFWASLPEAGLLPARWLVFAAQISLACTVLPSRWKLPVAAGFLVEFLMISHGLTGMTHEGPDEVTSWIVTAVVGLPGVLLALIQKTRSRLEILEARNDQLHASVLQLTSANTEFLEHANAASEESAVLERHRITRELHDVVGQTLTNIIMMMDATLHRKVHEPEETVKLLKWIRKQAQDGLAETRGVLYELRALKPTRLRGIKALKKLIETFSRLSRIKTQVEWGNLPWTFDPQQEYAVYHLVQGSLSNAFRHGSATQIDLHFQVVEGVLKVMIRDNGKGGPDSASGIGQKGMEERLSRWGGTVSFHSEPFGYVVQAAMPIQEESHGPVQDPDRR